LDRGKRFTDAGPEFTGNLTEGIQYIFFSRSLYLFLSKNVSSAAVLGAQPQHVLAPETRNRTIEHGRAAGPLADFPGDLWGKSRIGWLAHETQCLLDALVRNEAEEGRLFQLDCQTPTKRLVKHRVAGRVDEVGEHNRVLVGEFRHAVQIEVGCD